MHLTYSSALSELCEVNSSFDTGVLRIAYTNKNRNGSYISKEVFEKCMDTIHNVPIVCNYCREDDSIGGHDMDVAYDNDGNIKLVNLTTPIGVVPESAEPYWEIVAENNGEMHEYLCTDVLLWKRQDVYEKLKRDGVTSESMEITVKDGERDKDGTYVIKDFEFTAFCILGDDVEPCFESASLEVFSHSEFKEEMEKMMAELKETYSMVVTPSGDDDTHPQISAEGGNGKLEEKLAIVAEYGLNAEELDFSLEEMSEDELREKLEGMKEEFSKAEEVVEDAVAEDEPAAEPEEKFELDRNMRDNMHRAVRDLAVTKCRWSGEECPKYWLEDFDVEAKYAYCYDEDDGLLYRFAYSMDGDNIVLDEASKTRMKLAYVEYVDGEANSSSASVFEMVEDICERMSKKADANENAANEKINSLNAELEELRKFKMDVENEADANARAEIFSRFAELDGEEAYEAVKADSLVYNLEELEEKCFAILGRHGLQVKTVSEPKAPKLPVEKTVRPGDMLYGGLFAKYGTKAE